MLGTGWHPFGLFQSPPPPPQPLVIRAIGGLKEIVTGVFKVMFVIGVFEVFVIGPAIGAGLGCYAAVQKLAGREIVINRSLVQFIVYGVAGTCVGPIVFTLVVGKITAWMHKLGEKS